MLKSEPTAVGVVSSNITERTRLIKKQMHNSVTRRKFVGSVISRQHLNFIKLFNFHTLLILAWAAVLPAVNADEYCKDCLQSVDVSGQFAHHKIGDDQEIQGATGDPTAFREEIYGKNFRYHSSTFGGGQIYGGYW